MKTCLSRHWKYSFCFWKCFRTLVRSDQFNLLFKSLFYFICLPECFISDWIIWEKLFLVLNKMKGRMSREKKNRDGVIEKKFGMIGYFLKTRKFCIWRIFSKILIEHSMGLNHLLNHNIDRLLHFLQLEFYLYFDEMCVGLYEN